LQRTCTSLTLGSRPLNAKVVGQQAVDGGPVGDGHRARGEVESLLAMIGVRGHGALVKVSLGQTSRASHVRTSHEVQLGACACGRRSTRRWGQPRRSGRRGSKDALARGPRRSLERSSNQREDPLVMKDVVRLEVVDGGAARLRARSKFRQQERVGQLPNPPLQRTTASCNSRSMANLWSRRRGLGPRLLATPVLSTISSRRR
jgi:hypothetical protein